MPKYGVIRFFLGGGVAISKKYVKQSQVQAQFQNANVYLMSAQFSTNTVQLLFLGFVVCFLRLHLDLAEILIFCIHRRKIHLGDKVDFSSNPIPITVIPAMPLNPIFANVRTIKTIFINIQNKDKLSFHLLCS